MKSRVTSPLVLAAGLNLPLLERARKAAVLVEAHELAKAAPIPSGHGTGRCACGRTISRNKTSCQACA
jgi:hypothetical protein